MEGDDSEILAKLTLIRLDPTIRILLATIERFKQLAGGGSDVPATSLEENKVSLIKSQILLLDALRDELHTLVDTDPKGAAAVNCISDYLLLPLHAILQSFRAAMEEGMNSALRSLLWRSQEEAANILTLMLKAGVQLTLDKRLSLIVACTLDLDATVKDSLQHSDRLDRGEKISTSLLRCLQALIGDVNDTDVSTLLEMHIVEKMVLLCVEILDKKEVKRDQELSMEALRTMSALMARVDDQQFWRSLSPGLFVSIFRRIQDRGDASSKVIAQSLECLSQFLSITLKPADATLVKPIDMLDQLRNLSEGITDNFHDKQDDFSRACHNSLPILLKVIFKTLPTSPSIQVRLAVVLLCKSFLMNTWTTLVDDTMQETAMRCCIMLSNDLNSDVRRAAHETLDLVKTTPTWRMVGSTLGTTVLDIVTELPTATRTSSVHELRSTLQLARGYIETCDKSSAAAAIGEALLVPEPDIRLCLASLFDVDFENLQPSIIASKRQIRFRFIRNETITQAHELVRALGAAIGSKRACRLVDACFADLHESCTARAGSYNLSWVHEWVGTIILSEQILVGVIEMKQGDAKENKRTRKRVKALTTSLFPFLASSPVWNLPTVYENEWGSRKTHNLSAETIRGNAAMVSLILRVVGTLVDYLALAMSDLFPCLMYPLVEKTSDHNHSQVKSAALEVLEKIAKASGCSTLNNLISMNFDNIFGAIEAKLCSLERVGSDGGQPLGGISSIARTALTAGLKHSVGERALLMKRGSQARNNVNITIKTAKELISFFDRRLAQVNESNNIAPLFDLIEFFDGSLVHVIDSFGLTRESLAIALRQARPAAGEPWKDLLLPFRVTQQTAGCSASSFADHSNPTAKKQDNIDITDHELHYVSLVLARCGYLISHPSLTVRIASCKVQVLAFSFLGFVTEHFVKLENDDTGDNPSNAIYRQVNDSWPAISSRIETLSKEFAGSQRANGVVLHISKALPAKDISTNVIFLATLLDLVGAMSAVSGSFMWRRLKTDALPACARILEARLRSLTTDLRRIDSKLLSGEDKLLISVLELYETIFCNKELAESATWSIASIGAMVLPFIAEQHPIGDAAMQTLKAMISVDSDALVRALLSTSGEGLPPNPLGLHETGTVKTAAVKECYSSLLQTRASELLCFTRSVPEQPLDY